MQNLLSGQVFQVRNAGGGENFHNFKEVRDYISPSYLWKNAIHRSIGLTMAGIFAAHFVYTESEPKYNFRYSKLK